MCIHASFIEAGYACSIVRHPHLILPNRKEYITPTFMNVMHMRHHQPWKRTRHMSMYWFQGIVRPIYSKNFSFDMVFPLPVSTAFCVSIIVHSRALTPLEVAFTIFVILLYWMISDHLRWSPDSFLVCHHGLIDDRWWLGACCIFITWHGIRNMNYLVIALPRWSLKSLQLPFYFTKIIMHCQLTFSFSTVQNSTYVARYLRR